MSQNLLKWPNLDSTELRILLHEIIGGMGQADLGSGKPIKFYLPMAGPDCRVVVTFKGKKVVGIERGDAFDEAQWREISKEIEHSLLAGSTKVGREYQFQRASRTLHAGGDANLQLRLRRKVSRLR
jgi:hypothetical protein